MRFGNREVCDLIFTKVDTSNTSNGPASFEIKSAKMTSMEGSTTTVYAQGGKGNARLIAWEGEKTVTFTVEDALISMDTYWALTGSGKSATTIDGKNAVRFTATTTSFAGYYSVTASTLFRDEEGVDHAAHISIPKAKLQTSLNLSMSPSGDPQTFTFTFDVFPDANNTLFTFDIVGTDDTTSTDTTKVVINGTTYSTTNTAPTLAVTDAGVISMAGASGTFPTLQTGEVLTNFDISVARGTAASLPLAKGSISSWYII